MTAADVYLGRQEQAAMEFVNRILRRDGHVASATSALAIPEHATGYVLVEVTDPITGNRWTECVIECFGDYRYALRELPAQVFDEAVAEFEAAA